MTRLIWEPKTDQHIPQETIDRQVAYYAAGSTIQKEETMLETQKFVRRPFEVEAVQVTPTNIDLVAQWCGSVVEGSGDKRYIKVKVLRPQTTPPRQQRAELGDWVLYAGSGFKVYLAKPFEKSFDATGVTVVHPEIEIRDEPKLEVVAVEIVEPDAQFYVDPADGVTKWRRPSPALMPQFKRQPEVQAGFTTDGTLVEGV